MSEKINEQYEIVSDAIGKGGMGTVFRGRDTHTDAIVAIKQLKPEIVQDDPGIVERFMREGEALRRLNHPNIVKVLDTVEAEGYHYIIMEYVSGGSLRDLLTEQGQLSIEQVLHIALELADALTRAHHLRIIHRDIKPANVLLAEDGTPRLTDFGIARLDDKSRVTETGSLMGTFSYLSPEACSGEELDARTDIWSFGVMLHEMLSGDRPFEEDQIAATITSILTKEPPYIADIRPDTPEALANLIHRMLEKDRDKRPSSTRLVGAELEAILRGEDTPTSPSYASRFETPTSADSPTVIVKDGSASRRWHPYAVVVVIIVAILGLAAILLGGQNATPDETTPVSAASVEPADADEYMVLVAQIENVGGTERDVTRFIVDDLKQRLELEVPFSNVVVREYNNIISSDTTAVEIAVANGAAVIVWGNYNDARIQLDVQIGSLAAFPHNSFEHEDVADTANVRIEMKDEQTQSLAQQALGVLSVMHLADGNVFEWGRAMAIREELTVDSPPIVSGGIAPDVQEFLNQFTVDDQQAREIIDRAINKDSGNALLYLMRTIHLERLLIESIALFSTDFQPLSTEWARDMSSVLTLSPADWFPTVFFGMRINSDIEINGIDPTLLLQKRSGDWYAAFLVAFGNEIENRTVAESANHIDQAINLAPDISLPYSLAVMQKLRLGDIKAAVRLMDQIASEFPDPKLADRFFEIIGGFRVSESILASLINDLLIDQYESVVQNASDYYSRNTARFGTDSGQGGIWLFAGVAHCRLGDYQETSDAYSLAARHIAIFPLLQLLRADTQLALGSNPDGMYQIIANSDQAEILAPYVYGVQQGILGCENIFDLEALQAAEEAYANRPVPSVEPVGEGEYMVLVAQIENVGGAERDVTRFIVDDLKQRLEVEVPFSNVRVREFDSIITSDEEAIEIAELNGASVIVWGNYNDTRVQLDVQVGSLNSLPYNQFDRKVIEQVANVRVEMTDPLSETIASYVMGIMATLYNADGDYINTILAIGIASDLYDSPAQIVSRTVSADVHRFLSTYNIKQEGLFDRINAAVDTEPDNPLLYVFRAHAYLRESLKGYEHRSSLNRNDVEQGLNRDIDTAEQLGPENWSSPVYIRIYELLFLNNTLNQLEVQKRMEAMTLSIIDLRPDDWYANWLYAVFQMQFQSLSEAQLYIEQAVALDVRLGIAHEVATQIFLFNGNVVLAAETIDNMRNLIPDPDVEKIINLTQGDIPDIPGSGEIFMWFVLGQYETVQVKSDTYVQSGFSYKIYERATSRLWRGLADCQLGEYGTAWNWLTQAAPQQLGANTFQFARLVLADVRLKQGDTDRAARQFETINGSLQAQAFAPYVYGVQQGILGCENIFDLEALQAAEEAYAALLEATVEPSP